MTYAEKLRDPRWQKKRLEILNRDNFSCLRCGDTEHTLHVHHKYYENGKDPWDYGSRHLITLCEQCHELEEHELRDNSALLIDTFRRSNFSASDIMDFAEGINVIGNLEDHNPFAVMMAFKMAMKDDEVRESIISIYKARLRKAYNY